jgi:glutaredoxin 3
MSAPAPKIVLYATPFCGYCAAARSLLADKRATYTEIDVMFDADKRAEMVALSGRSTVPQIFIGERHIGGFDDLAALDRRGELDPLLRSSNDSQQP